MVIFPGCLETAALVFVIDLQCHVWPLLSITAELAQSEAGIAAEAGIACAVRSWHGVPASTEYPMYESHHAVYLTSTAGSVYLSDSIHTMEKI